MKKFFVLLMVLALSGLVTGSASAVVIYDNFGPGDTFQTGIGWTISDGPPIYDDWDQGDSFTVGGTVDITVTDIYIALGYVTGENKATIWLMDDAGGIPGTTIATYTISNMGTFGNAYTPSHIVDGVTTLQYGQKYWLIASGTGSSQGHWSAWNFNNTGATSDHAYRKNLGAWTASNNTAGAFRIEGNPVPEPVTLSLLGLGVVPFLRRKK